MKNFIYLFFFLLTTSNCTLTESHVKPKSEPIVLTEIFEVSATSAKVGGVVEYDGNYDIFEHGIIWSTSPDPFINGQDVEVIGGPHFWKELDLDENETIYFTAYARNYLGYGLGKVLSFKTGTFEVDIPCSPINNSFNFNHSDWDVTVETQNSGNRGDYAVVGTTGSSFKPKIHVEFDKAPKSGEYVTGSDCYVIIWSGGTANWIFFGEKDKKVYVKKLGENKYDITFCEMHFTSSGTIYEFDTGCNLTTD